MKDFDVTVQIVGLAGVETRTIEVKAKTADSARAKVEAKMGNRTFYITGTVELCEECGKTECTDWCGIDPAGGSGLESHR